MIKKTFIALISLVFVFNINVRADEGMWLLSLIGKNYEQMKAQGLKLTPEDIYNINNSSVKDAIVGLSDARAPFGFFCSGEIISSQGLVLTNHHCGYGKIQAHSTVEHNYLKDGFWAKSKDQELANEGMMMSRLVKMEDVTAKVLTEIKDDMSEADRVAAVKKAMKAIEKEAGKDSDYGTSVKSMFEGNQFFLFYYETFKDIRLVGAPPSSIGKFGGDTDNWMWPRHTGDFSIFRIYSSKEGKPAKFSKDNIAYKPVHHLPVSIKGVKDGDFAMVMGFPGSTDRFLSSYGIEEALDITNPSTVKIRDKKLEIMRKYMNSSRAIKIQYSAKYAQTANYWKYFIGQSKGLKSNHIYDKKKNLETQYDKWANADEARKAKYGDALSLIEKHYVNNKSKALAKTYLFEALLQGGEIVMFPYAATQLKGVLTNTPDNTELINDLTKELKKGSDKHFKDYNIETDKEIFAALLEMYYNDVPKDNHLPIFTTIQKKFKGNFNKYANYVYNKSIFASQEKFNAFLEKPSAKVIEKDPAFLLTNEVIMQYFKMQGGSDLDFDKGKRLFVDGLMQMKTDKTFYPDANSTLRLTFGNVGDYDPADAVHYNYYTTLKGIIEKEDTTTDEFIVPAKLKELYKAKDYGKYGSNGYMPVCFTTNNDITGGNSGSGVINGNGELIGTAFDGNWEAMSGDIAFEDKLQKCINVDIRYTLFIIDKYAGATNLIEEMTIIE